MTDRQDTPVSVPKGLRKWVELKHGWKQETPTGICEVFRAGDGTHTLGLYDFSTFSDEDAKAVKEMAQSDEDIKAVYEAMQAFPR